MLLYFLFSCEGEPVSVLWVCAGMCTVHVSSKNVFGLKRFTYKAKAGCEKSKIKNKTNGNHHLKASYGSHLVLTSPVACRAQGGRHTCREKDTNVISLA